MPTSSDVKVPLHFVPFEAPKYSAAIGGLSSSQLGRRGKFPAPFVHVAEDMPNMLVLLFFCTSSLIVLMKTLVLLSFLLLVCPESPARVVLCQQVSC